MDEMITISKAQLTAWSDSLIHMNHHGTLVQREIEAGNFERAAQLAERARKRAWTMLKWTLAHDPTGGFYAWPEGMSKRAVPSHPVTI